MDWFHALILGFVEGLTEFLPISSTGHLIVVSELMGLPQNAANTSFEVIIQLAAILAVVALYAEKLQFKYWELWLKVVIAFLPIAAVGFVFQDLIKQLFSVPVVAIMFIVGGVVFLVLEFFYKETQVKTQSMEQMTYKQAVWIGIAQVFALIPGTSRAGSTIIGALLVGLSRKASAEFSFLLALPVMVAASGLDLLKHYDEFNADQWLALAIGFVVSFVVAYAVMKLFIQFLQRFTFTAIGIYRILFGVLLLVLLQVGYLQSGAH